jgi:predicted aspartyl protease
LRAGFAVAAIFGLGWAGPTAAKCQLQQAAELHVSVENRRVLIPLEINGQPVQMILDTGAALSMRFPGAVERLGLTTHYMPESIRLYGVGGQAHPKMVILSTLNLDRTYRLKDFTMAVAGGQGVASETAVGLLGQDILAAWDVEIDLAHDRVRLLHPVGCARDEMVFWEGAYSDAPIVSDPSLFTHTTVRALLNGKGVDAYLDTGAQGAVVTLLAAEQAGVRPGSPQVQKAGVARGIGDYSAKTWIAVFNTFSLGQETVGHAKIRMADMFEHATFQDTNSRIATRADLPGMLLGADFFQAHHVLISNSQHLIYFSYNGGPVFDTSRPPTQASATPAIDSAAQNTPSSKPPQTAGADGKGADRP